MVLFSSSNYNYSLKWASTFEWGKYYPWMRFRFDPRVCTANLMFTNVFSFKYATRFAVMPTFLHKNFNLNLVSQIRLTMHVVAEIYPTITSVDQWTSMYWMALLILHHICKLLAISDFTNTLIFNSNYNKTLKKWASTFEWGKYNPWMRFT